MWTVIEVDFPSADGEFGRVMTGVAENTNSTAAATTQRRVRRIRRVRTGKI